MAVRFDLTIKHFRAVHAMHFQVATHAIQLCQGPRYSEYDHRIRYVWNCETQQSSDFLKMVVIKEIDPQITILN